MKSRPMLICLTVTVIVALTAGVALAKTINGTAGADDIAGTPNADRISGRAGNDLIEGRGGSDTLVGGADNDTLRGNRGHDTAYGLSGIDTIAADRAVGGDGRDRLVGYEMMGGNGDDRIGDTIWGQPAGGALLASGGDGNDTINVLEHPYDISDGKDTPDTVKCGVGADDRVKANPDDSVADDCEIVRIIEQ